MICVIGGVDMYQEWFKEYEKIKNESKEKNKKKGQSKN